MIAKRYNNNPLLMPSETNSWEAEATFNGCPIKERDKIHLFYRAESTLSQIGDAELRISSVGYATSNNKGETFKDRTRLITPEYEWEKYGCEDPRVTKINGTYYIFYTALSRYPFEPDGIKIGLATTKDLKNIQKHRITTFNSKAMALFPEKIKGKYVAILSVDTDNPPAKIGLAFFDKEKDIYSKKYWNKWYERIDKHSLDLRDSENDHVEVGAAPVRTKAGWLIIYSHIKNYFSPHGAAKPVFEIKAALLDLNDPYKMIGKTDTPLLLPEKEYEIYGQVPNIVFPSGAFIEKDELHLYYGGADTVCCAAKIKLDDVIADAKNTSKNTFSLKRYNKNPILTPKQENEWEARSVFNPGVIHLGGRFHLLYRAISNSNISVMGYASSRDGYQIEERGDEPVYTPRTDIEKNDRGESYGCEDARLIKIKDKIYMFYTAYNGIDHPRVAVTYIKEKDFLNKNWKWAEPMAASPRGLSNKDAVIFPEKINGKYVALHRLNNKSIDIQYLKDLTFKEDTLSLENNWINPRPGMWDSEKVGINAEPIKTKEGWLILYHGISEYDRRYRFGALLTKPDRPEEVIARTRDPIFEPETVYEKEGDVPGVVFSCGHALVDDTLFIYYGGGDKVIGLATVNINKLLKEVKRSKID
jgi:predicted GH43/DUF377 family glycosyl hydrolase